MAVWSKALPLTAACRSPLPGFESWLGHVRNLQVTLGLDGGFSPSTLHQFQLASDENRNSKFII